MYQFIGINAFDFVKLSSAKHPDEHHEKRDVAENQSCHLRRIHGAFLETFSSGFVEPTCTQSGRGAVVQATDSNDRKKLRGPV
jgi:hypothetical protein